MSAAQPSVRGALAWLALASCSGMASCGPTEPDRQRPAPAAVSGSDPIVQAAPALPALQRARLEYLFDAFALVAEQWPSSDRALPCVLLMAPDAQWVVGCDVAPSGFVQLAERFRAQPVYARSGGGFGVADSSLTTREWLERAPATAHVDAPDTKDSDLPAGRAWLLLGTLEAIKHRADFRDCMTDEWLSIAVHEFMHVLQLRAPSFEHELRAILSGEIDAKPLSSLFTSDARYRALVEREYAILVAGVSGTHQPAVAASTLLRWREQNRRRRAHLIAREGGAQLEQADRVFSYLEGMARYVESRFLVEASQHPARAIAQDREFRRFARYEGGGYAAMQNRQLDAEYHYAIGFHLALLLDRVDPSWTGRVDSEPGWLIGLAEHLAPR